MFVSFGWFGWFAAMLYVTYMFGPLGLVERARVAAPVFSVDVASALRNSPVLSECHARVAAAGCDLEPAFASGATLLIPMTLELYQEPLPPTYCGHATSSLHRPTLREVSTGYGDDPESLRPGLLEMIEHIHDDATDVLALIHDSVATKDPSEKRIETRGRAVAAAPRSGNKQGS